MFLCALIIVALCVQSCHQLVLEPCLQGNLKEELMSQWGKRYTHVHAYSLSMFVMELQYCVDCIFSRRWLLCSDKGGRLFPLMCSQGIRHFHLLVLLCTFSFSFFLTLPNFSNLTGPFTYSPLGLKNKTNVFTVLGQLLHQKFDLMHPAVLPFLLFASICQMGLFIPFEYAGWFNLPKNSYLQKGFMFQLPN